MILSAQNTGNAGSRIVSEAKAGGVQAEEFKTLRVGS
jgi:hypothetical protein